MELLISIVVVHYDHHLSLNCESCWGTTDDFTTSFLLFSLFFTALWDLANSKPVHSLMLSSYLFFCLPCFLPPFTVPCKMVWPDQMNGRHTIQYKFIVPVGKFLSILLQFASFYDGQVFVWSDCLPYLMAQTSSLVTWCLYEMRSILQ